MSYDVVLAPHPSGLGRRVAGGAGWSLTGRVLVAGLGLASGAVLARTLSSEQMGIYLLASNFVIFAALVSSGGINQLCIRYVSEHLARQEEGMARQTLHILLRLGLVCGVAGALGAAGVVRSLGGAIYAGSDLLSVAVLIGAWALLTAAQALVADCLRGFGDIRAASIYGGPLSSALFVGTLLAMLALGVNLTVTTALLLPVVAGMLNVGFGAVALCRRAMALPASAVAPARLRVHAIFGASLPLLLTTVLMVVLTSTDLWLLGVWHSAGDVAAYGVAARTATLVGMPLLVLSGVLAPVTAGLYASGHRIRLERVLQGGALAATVPALLLAAVFAAAGGPLLGIVYGDHYRSGAFALAVLSMGQVVSVGTGACGLVLTMTGHTRPLVTITGVTLAITVVLLLLTVPRWGGQAAAPVAAGGIATLNIAAAVAARRLTGLSTVASPATVARVIRRVFT